MTHKETMPLNPKTFLTKVGNGKTVLKVKKKEIIFLQGDTADALFYLMEGRIKLSMVSPKGKEAVVAILGKDDFFGEGCLAGQPVRTATATSMDDAVIVRIEKSAMVVKLHKDPIFSELFITYLLSRNIRIEEALVDQLFNSSEKRLARILLLLAQYGKEGKTEAIIPKISQETLAEMVGTTRPRINSFMNKFRKLGFIAYNDELHIHNSLLNILLHD